MVTTFDRAVAVVIDTEGGYQARPEDPGNWTGGACGSGECRGTRYGISAAAYPALDIAALTLAGAQAIYRADYWIPIAGDALPPMIALCVFDAAVHSGVVRAVGWLQAALGVAVDGVVGPRTLKAAQGPGAGGAAVCAEMAARRLVFLSGRALWRQDGLGWARRVCRLPYQAMEM